MAVLPDWWLGAGAVEQAKLAMLSKFVGSLGSCKGLAREGVILAAELVSKLGDGGTANSLRELL